MIIKNQKELEILREGGKRLAAVLQEVAHHAIAGVSARELDDLAEKLILKAGGAPSFKGYKVRGAPMPYPGSLCVSINNEIVHGLPTDRVLSADDVVGLDIGMVWPSDNGLYTDTAMTLIVGEDFSWSDSDLPKAQVLQDLAQPDGASRAIRQLASLEFRRSGQADMRVLTRPDAEALESARRLIAATKKSLEIGIAEVRAGTRVGDIGSAIQEYL